MEVETSPLQPDAVRRALAETLAEGAGDVDPWWQAGIEEAVGEHADRPPFE